MNKTRRKNLSNISAILENAESAVEFSKEEEEECFEGLPENFQEGERGEKMTEAIEKLDGALDAIREAIEAINEAAE